MLSQRKKNHLLSNLHLSLLQCEAKATRWWGPLKRALFHGMPFAPGWLAPSICRTLLEGGCSWLARYYHLAPPSSLPSSSNLLVASTVCDLGHTTIFFVTNS